MNREVSQDDFVPCDNCGKETYCFDFMGDFLCPECADKIIDSDEDD